MPNSLRAAIDRGRRADIDTYASYAIAVLAFALSYSKLVDLASRAGYSEYMAPVWPLIVDGLAVMAARGVLRLVAGRWYPWALLIAGTVVSILAAVLNAMVPPGPLPPAATAAVTIIPALCLPFAAHLARKMRDAAAGGDATGDSARDVAAQGDATADVARDVTADGSATSDVVADASHAHLAPPVVASAEVGGVTCDVSPVTSHDPEVTDPDGTERDATLHLVASTSRRRPGQYTEEQKAAARKYVKEDGLSLRAAGQKIGGAPGETVRRWLTQA